jgi:hypothetical protein
MQKICQFRHSGFKKFFQINFQLGIISYCYYAFVKYVQKTWINNGLLTYINVYSFKETFTKSGSFSTHII